MNNKESIIQKIRKLLALAEGNKNEHEREVAMQFAMELLSKHNLITGSGTSSGNQRLCSRR